MSISRVFGASVFVLLAAGCGSSGPPLHTVKGKVELPGASAALLAGHSVEVASVTDPTVRAYGEIKPDGSFALESLQAGEIKRGALAGKYIARIVLTDDDPAARQQAALTLDPRVLDFQTSGLTLDVPAEEVVTLAVKRR